MRDWSPGGLRALDLSTMQVRTIAAAQGLTSPNVRNIMADREGSVWVSTRDALFRNAPGSDRFELIDVPSPVNDPSEIFHTTMMDAHGQVWAAGSRGLARFSAGKWTRFTERDGLKSGDLSAIAQGQDALWIAYRAGDAERRARIAEQPLLLLRAKESLAGTPTELAVAISSDGSRAAKIGVKPGHIAHHADLDVDGL